MEDEPGPDGSVEGRGAPRRRSFREVVQAYLFDIIFGANDGIITTLAVVSGVTGAALSDRVIVILGFANLFADGFSMGASNYLASRSNPKLEDRPVPRDALRKGGATLFSFIVAGMVPLSAYLLPIFEGQRFQAAVALGLIALFGIGAGRAAFTDRTWFRAGLEMLLIGVLAAGVAYGVGAAAAAVTGNTVH